MLEDIISTRRRGLPPSPSEPLSAADLGRLFAVMDRMYLPRAVARYISRLVAATHPRGGEATAEVNTYVTYGASPRAAIAIAEASRAHALLAGRPTVGFEDVRAVVAAGDDPPVDPQLQSPLRPGRAQAIIQGLLDTLDEAGLGLPADVRIEKAAAKGTQA